eukprot:TRINITY_DN10650_c0_g1_i1.p1 TRINITY_DN10650_c0_g1~~TRINITY_DN10650_c0_g1_i1.p1  ORF type:complete len:306 (+),score=75.40 TRINITY_DN10650_c0_g1_i1:116-1033(+)
MSENDNIEVSVMTDKQAVIAFLHEINMDQYLTNFFKNGFDDIEMVKELSDEDLEEIGIDKLGHRKKILKFCQTITNEDKYKISPFNEDHAEFFDVSDDGEPNISAFLAWKEKFNIKVINKLIVSPLSDISNKVLTATDVIPKNKGIIYLELSAFSVVKNKPLQYVYIGFINGKNVDKNLQELGSVGGGFSWSFYDFKYKNISLTHGTGIENGTVGVAVNTDIGDDDTFLSIHKPLFKFYHNRVGFGNINNYNNAESDYFDQMKNKEDFHFAVYYQENISVTIKNCYIIDKMVEEIKDANIIKKIL